MPTSIEEFAEEHADLLFAMGVASGVMFVTSLVAVPWMLARIPADYFVRESSPWDESDHRWIIKVIRRGVKNLLGAMLFLAGLAMVGLPGQGLLTMLIGLSLLDFPGKRRLELNLIRRPKVHRAINWLRAKQGRQPLILDVPPAMESKVVPPHTEPDAGHPTGSMS